MRFEKSSIVCVKNEFEINCRLQLPHPILATHRFGCNFTFRGLRCADILGGSSGGRRCAKSTFHRVRGPVGLSNSPSDKLHFFSIQRFLFAAKFVTQAGDEDYKKRNEQISQHCSNFFSFNSFVLTRHSLIILVVKNFHKLHVRIPRWKLESEQFMW